MVFQELEVNLCWLIFRPFVEVEHIAVDLSVRILCAWWVRYCDIHGIVLNDCDVSDGLSLYSGMYVVATMILITAICPWRDNVRGFHDGLDDGDIRGVRVTANMTLIFDTSGVF